jgi:hypothetical protein
MNTELAGLQAEFSFFGLDKIDRQHPRWHSTGKLLRKHRPEIYRLAVELLGADRHGRRELCELLHVSHHTLESIEQEQAESLATLRQKAARENMQLHRMSLERAGELIPGCADLQKVAVASGIFAEKSQLFAGEATARIATAEPIDLVARFGAFIAELEKKVAAREAEATIMPAIAQIGLTAKNKAPKAAAALPGQSDCSSDGLGDLTQERGQAANKEANKPEDTPSAAAGAADGGGGGRRAAPRGPMSDR